MHVKIPRLRDATELNNDGMIKFVDVHYQTEPNLSIFPKEIWSTMTPASVCLFFQELTWSDVFSFWKAFVKCPSLSVNNIFDDVRCDVIST